MRGCDHAGTPRPRCGTLHPASGSLPLAWLAAVLVLVAEAQANSGETLYTYDSPDNREFNR